MRTFQHITHGEVKFGAKRSAHFGLPLTAYLEKASQLSFPPKVSWWRPIDFKMLGNGPDTYKGQPFSGVGDCVIAYMLHQIMVWNSVAHAGDGVTFDCDQAVDTYSAITGYVPGDDSTDNGTDPNAALTYWKTNGLYGHTVAGFVNLDLSNSDLLKAAIWYFGGVGLSIQVPAYYMQVPAGGSVSPVAGADTTIVGEHQVGLVGFGSQGFRFNQWGATYTLNEDFLSQFGVQAQAVVSSDFIKVNGMSASGVDLAGLLADLQAV